MTPHRWRAVTWPKQCVHNEAVPTDGFNIDPQGKGMTGDQLKKCMRNHQLGDCIGEKGVSMGLTGVHGSKKATTSSDRLRGHVIANWCSHKRLFEHLKVRNTTKEYFVVLEDDTILSKKFKERIDDFVQNYKEDWDSVQIDPFGTFEPTDKHNGKGVARPFEKNPSGAPKAYW